MNNNTPVADLTEAGVERIVRDLYNLKHFGRNLRSLQHGISLARQATNRERPFAVRRAYSSTNRRPRKLEIRSGNTKRPEASQQYLGGGGMMVRLYKKAKDSVWGPSGRSDRNAGGIGMIYEEDKERTGGAGRNYP
jgi:hypothetical protein